MHIISPVNRHVLDSKSKLFNNIRTKYVVHHIHKIENAYYAHEILSDAKVFGQMSDSIKPYCHSLNQSNFFLMERAKSELQLLYHTYFSGMKLRRRKS